MEAKRIAMDALAVSTKAAGYDTNHDTNAIAAIAAPRLSCWEICGHGRDRTDDLFHAI
jgi:hypothetical protein